MDANVRRVEKARQILAQLVGAVAQDPELRPGIEDAPDRTIVPSRQLDADTLQDERFPAGRLRQQPRRDHADPVEITVVRTEEALRVRDDLVLDAVVVCEIGEIAGQRPQEKRARREADPRAAIRTARLEPREGVGREDGEERQRHDEGVRPGLLVQEHEKRDDRRRDRREPDLRRGPPESHEDERESECAEHVGHGVPHQGLTDVQLADAGIARVAVERGEAERAQEHHREHPKRIPEIEPQSVREKRGRDAAGICAEPRELAADGEAPDARGRER